jgi:hypothetical protein
VKRDLASLGEGGPCGARDEPDEPPETKFADRDAAVLGELGRDVNDRAGHVSRHYRILKRLLPFLPVTK